MKLNLYNTATKSKEEFESDGIVTAYTCGLTVYSHPHIGNWRTFIFYDTLVRTLKINGFDVHDIQNITDVGHLVSDEDDGEDKLDKQAKLEKRTAWEVAEDYTQILYREAKALNIDNPFKMPKATNHIPEQVDMIKTLEEKDYTYTIDDDGVYFDTSKFKDYGKKLLGRNAKADKQFARIGANSKKKNPEDFALWKFSPKDQQRDMEWESPWGVGFPGWHLECSAMAKKYLGDTIDIHAGGIDHIPVHHTNEIAQSEAANDAEFARFWMHGEFILADGRKMSKSLGNIYTLEDIVKKGFSASDFRLFILQGHYRTETNFSFDNVASAKQRLNNFLSIAERVFSPTDKAEDNSKDFKKAQEQIHAALNDDLNTPQALTELNAAMDIAEKGIHPAARQAFIEMLQFAEQAFGIHIITGLEDIDDRLKLLIKTRAEAKAAKKYDRADAIREEIEKDGIEIDDSAIGSFWKRKRN